MADAHTSNDRGSYRFVVFLCCFAGLGGLTFGYGTAVVSGAMLQIKYQYDLSTIWHESIVSVTLGAAAVASACSGILTDRYGRRPVIILSSGLFTLASLILAITQGNGKLMMLSGRLITGLGIGFMKTLVKMLRSPSVRKALFLGCILQIYQQFCGINTVIYYSGSILRMSGFGSKLAIWLGCIPLAVNVIFTCVGVYAVDKLGRRLLGLISLAGLVVASIILAAGFQLSEINSPLVVSNLNLTYLSCPQMYRKCVDCIKDTNCGFCWTNKGHDITGDCLRSDPVRPDSYALSVLNATSKTCDRTQYEDGKEIPWGYDFCPSVYSWIAVVGMALFVLAFAPGIGPLSWTINSEIYPLWARGTGISVATAIKWISNLAVSMTFLTLTEYITTYGTFYVYAAISGSGFILFIFILPETKGKSLKEVEDLFTSKHNSSSGSGKINDAFEDTHL